MPGKKKVPAQVVEAPISDPVPYQPKTTKIGNKIQSSQLKGKPAEMKAAPRGDPTKGSYTHKIPTEPTFSSPAIDIDPDEANLEGEYDLTRPPQKLEEKDRIATLKGIQLEEVQAQLTEAGIAHHQLDKGEFVEADLPTINKIYKLCPQTIPLKENTEVKIGGDQGYVSGQMGDYNQDVSAESLFLAGQLVTHAERIKRALLYAEDIDQPSKEISFKKWQRIVNSRALEGLKLQIEKTKRDEIVMQLQQKNLMLNRNEIFEDMYFKKPVFQAKHQKTM